ncbi:MAG: hypothetical protein H0V24_14810, partial [Chloroflexia bacterium]|nr:hypothetical protein [Chloroflexia bacterium]
SGPPTVPASTAPPRPTATTGIAPVTPAPEAAITSGSQPVDAEITGAPANTELIPDADPPVIDAASSGDVQTAPIEAAGGDAEIAPIEAVPQQPPIAPPPVGAPEPGWPGIGGGGTQHFSSAGYSAIADGGGVSVYAPDGTALGVVGGGIPIWAPWGTSLLVIGPSGLGAVWDATTGGLAPVEPAAARDVPVGWASGSPLVQRVYLDGSGLVELRVVPVDGSGGNPLWSGTADSLFGEGVTAARLSPDGSQISFVSGGQLYIAPVGDPGSAAPAG